MDTLHFHKARLEAATVSELYGLCLGILADGIVTNSEEVFLRDWLAARPQLLEDPVVLLISDALDKYAGKAEDSLEHEKLIATLVEFTCVPAASENAATPSALPLCEPAPALKFDGAVVCCTGTFDYGTREKCKRLVEDLGGTFSKGVTKKIDYIVIGNQVTPDWKQRTYGCKIIKAMEYRNDKHSTLAIVSEDYWLEQASIHQAAQESA